MHALQAVVHAQDARRLADFHGGLLGLTWEDEGGNVFQLRERET